MIKSFALSSPSLIFDIRDSRSSTVCSSSRNSHSYIPKLEPFSRSKFDRVLKEPPLIQKCEKDLMDYCSTLEGDDSYSCWQAYFELKDLEKVSPKEDLEKLILQVGGLKSLIGCLHHVAAFSKGKKPWIGSAKAASPENDGAASPENEGAERPFPVPDGLPKSKEELEEEEKARMPDSPFTRLLRTKGKFPAWYSPAPDHETD